MYDYKVISKSRALLNMRNSGYTLGEFKILDIYLARINPLDPKTSRVVISLDEYCSVMGIDSGKVRESQLKKYTAHFLGNVVTMERNDGKKGYIQKPLFTCAEYEAEEKIIILECNPDPDIFNTFFNIQNIGYIRYILKNTLYLKSAFSYKLFTLIKSKSPANTFKIDLKELKEALGATAKKYESFKYFHRDALALAVEEINENTDTFVKYEKITKGRLTRGIKFYIEKNSKFDEKKIGQENEKMIVQDEFEVITTSDPVDEYGWPQYRGWKNEYFAVTMKETNTNWDMTEAQCDYIVDKIYSELILTKENIMEMSLHEINALKIDMISKVLKFANAGGAKNLYKWLITESVWQSVVKELK